LTKNKYLFNFSASHVGGGYKRLLAYSKIFNMKGGAYFIVHTDCKKLSIEFKNNTYFFVQLSNFKRLFNDTYYLKKIINSIGNIKLYYSYGIPIYSRIGNVNWFHLSNVLPLSLKGIPISIYDYVKMKILGARIRRNFINADVISAESIFSLNLIEYQIKNKLFLSVNGSDDEVFLFKKKGLHKKNNIAVVVGTYKYKAILDSYSIFEMLRSSNCHDLKLIIIGDPKNIPKKIIADNNVIIKGFLPHKSTINYLKKARYYISTTYLENSYNAASEGLLLANESYISDIAPHNELLINSIYKKISVKNIARHILWVQKKDINIKNLKLWENVVNEILNKIKNIS